MPAMEIREISRTFQIDVDLVFGDVDPFASVFSFRDIPLEDASGRLKPVSASSLMPGLRNTGLYTVSSRLDLLDLLVRGQPDVIDVRYSPVGNDLIIEVAADDRYDPEEFRRRIRNIASEVRAVASAVDVEVAAT